MSAVIGQLDQTIEQARSDALELPRVGHHQTDLDLVAPTRVRREARDANDLVGVEADRDECLASIATDIQEPFRLSIAKLRDRTEESQIQRPTGKRVQRFQVALAI